VNGILYFSTISGNTRLVGEALMEHFRIMGVELTLQDVAEDNSFKEQTTKNKLQKNIQKSSPED
jgi:menaquinone-dependent protoporphyrinogen IX oxidase